MTREMGVPDSPDIIEFDDAAKEPKSWRKNDPLENIERRLANLQKPPSFTVVDAQGPTTAEYSSPDRDFFGGGPLNPSAGWQPRVRFLA